MIKLYSKQGKSKGGRNMPVNVSKRKPNIKNLRSHALNATKKKQGLNLQVVRLANGKKVRISAKEKRTMLKDQQLKNVA